MTHFFGSDQAFAGVLAFVSALYYCSILNEKNEKRLQIVHTYFYVSAT